MVAADVWFCQASLGWVCLGFGWNWDSDFLDGELGVVASVKMVAHQFSCVGLIGLVCVR